MSEIAIVFGVLVALVVLFAWGRLPVEVVAFGAVLALAATGVLTFEQSLAGFGDPVVLFIASLFVVSEALDSTGVTTWSGQWMIARSGDSRLRLVVLMLIVVALLTAIVSVNAAVAALLPVVVVTATRLGIAPSKLLIPLCFGAHAGSQLALTGSNVNLLTNDALLEQTGVGVGFVEFALAGIPLLVGSIAVIALLGDRLLPVRLPSTISRDLSDHARTPFIGRPVFKGMVTDEGDLEIVAIQRHGEDLGAGPIALLVGDALLLKGPWRAIDTQAAEPGVLAVRRLAAGRPPAGGAARVACRGGPPRAGRHGGAPRDRGGPRRGRRPAGRWRADRAARGLTRTRLPGHQLDDGRHGRRDAAVVDRDVRVRSG
jgi:hypothetical protein